MTTIQFIEKHFWAIWWLIFFSGMFLGPSGKIVVREKEIK